MAYTCDFSEYTSPGAKKFIETAKRHFGNRILDVTIHGLLKNLKDDDLLTTLAMYIDMDTKNELKVDRMLEVVIYLMYYDYRRAHPKTKEELDAMYNGMDPDEYWGAEDYELDQMFP